MRFVSWLTPSRAPGSRLRFQSPFKLAARLGLLSLALAVLGESGHRLFLYLNATAAHHIFHIVFGGGAVVVFVVWVGIDIYRNGWPAYSWHLQPRRPAKRSLQADDREGVPQLEDGRRADRAGQSAPSARRIRASISR